MIGIGTWKCNVNSMIFKGEVIITIKDNNGQYDFDINIPGEKIPEFNVRDLSVTGNEMSFKVDLKGVNVKNIEINLIFDTENTFSGSVKVPFMGKMKLKDGIKIQDCRI